jgi:hypothetical protein
MIHTHKLKRLSSDEMTVLLYCVNDGKVDPPKIDNESISWVKATYAHRMLHEYAAKLTNEKKKKQVLDIAEKITKP